MAVVNIIGGLGNQLFQYAFGKYIEKNFKVNLKFDIHTDLVANNFTTRNLDIEKLNVSLPIATNEEIKKYKYYSNGLFSRLERKLAQKRIAFHSKYIVQQNAHSLLQRFDINSYYDGYWQCYEYIDDVKDVLLNEIKIPTDFYSKHNDILNEFNTSNSVAIHIRRDDYINVKVNAELFEVCEMNYYNHAIQIIEEKYPDAKFYIFTQDIEWAKENFLKENFTFIEGNSAIDDMLLMSFCKHNIIANSTFSWWSAWLNRNTSKIVLAPKKWYKGKRNQQTDNLIPPNWLRI